MKCINEDILDLLIALPSEIILIVLFIDPTLEIESIPEAIILLIDFHQDHIQDLHFHHRDFSMLSNQISLKIQATVLKNFQTHRQN